jgi:hypothetical protein
MLNNFITVKTISLGSIFGIINFSGEKTLLRLGGILETHENKIDKYTGIPYIIFRGQFLANNLCDGVNYSGTSCILPSIAEQYAWSACRQQRTSPRFLMDIIIIPSPHSLGYDFKIKPLMAFDPETDPLAELSDRMAEPITLVLEF